MILINITLRERERETAPYNRTVFVFEREREREKETAPYNRTVHVREREIEKTWKREREKEVGR